MKTYAVKFRDSGFTQYVRAANDKAAIPVAILAYTLRHGVDPKWDSYDWKPVVEPATFDEVKRAASFGRKSMEDVVSTMEKVCVDFGNLLRSQS